jgi:hypothetical protein
MLRNKFRRWCSRVAAAERRGRPPSRRLSLEGLEDRVTPVVTYHGGPLLANVGVENVFYGSAWSADPTLTPVREQLNGFAGAITNSTYLDQLREYSEPGHLIGRGQFLGAAVDPVSLSPGQFVSDGDIVGQLNAMIVSGQLRRPDANRLYVVYTPPDVHVRLPDGQDSIHDFLGYHSSFRDTFNEAVNYAVVVHQAGNASLGGWGYNAFQQFTEVTSHELAEAVTDPDVRTGWFDSALGSQGEIGDLANLDIATLNGYTVQKEWSNLQFAATGNGPFLLQAPDFRPFAMLGNGTIYVLDTGVLWRRDAIGNWDAFDTGVLSFALDGTNVFALRTNGDLIYFNSASHGILLDTQVQAIAGSGGGYVFDLDTDGNLITQYGDSASHGILLDTGVQAIAGSGGGYVFDLHTDGSLITQYGDSASHGLLLDTGVQSFVLGPGGYTVDVLKTDGDLYQHQASDWTVSTLLDQGVVEIWLDNGGYTLFALQDDGTIQQFPA